MPLPLNGSQCSETSRQRYGAWPTRNVLNEDYKNTLQNLSDHGKIRGKP